jgi:hypothetical protein
MTSSVCLTADGIIGGSGKKIRVSSVEFMSNGTAGILVLRNGAADTATVYVTRTGVINSSVTVSWPEGLTFPDGCFFDKGTNVTSVVVEFEQLN